MISKPLFKQSCKANAGVWFFVTLITCAMLAIIIIVLGNLNVNEIRSSMKDMFVKDALESQIEESSMTYYDITDISLSNFEENFEQLNNLLNVQLKNFRNNIIMMYKGAIQNGISDEAARAQVINTLSQMLPPGSGFSQEELALAVGALIDYYLYYNPELSQDVTVEYSEAKISQYVLNKIAEGVHEKLIKEYGQETADYARDFIISAINQYIEQKNENSQINVTEFATSYIPSVLEQVFYEQSFDYNDEKIYVSKYFTKEKIYELSYAAIISFRGQLEVKEKQLRSNPDYTEERIAEELEKYKKEVIEDRSKMLIESLPEKVSKALVELGEMDVYELVIGNIFYRIAGLLLPMIFVIMASNNLIAGQVDSGSMAYVLSTPTKRRTVTITQMCYLITSLFVMYALTAITSVVSLTVVGTEDITISYEQMLLLNLGAFVTMFAVSGICFLCSCWFNRSKLAMSYGGGLTMFFLVATILGLFGSNVIPSAIRIDAMKYFNYVSLISLFDATSILANSADFLWKLAILIGVGVVTFILGIIKFDKKDLPL